MSASTVLAAYVAARDAVVAAIAAGGSVAELQQGGRRVRYTEHDLPMLEQMISYYQRQVDLLAGKTGRNHARIRR